MHSLSKSTLWALLLGGLLVASPTSAQRPSKIVAETTAARHGLTRQWLSQMQIDRHRDKLQTLLVSGDTVFAQAASGKLQAFDAETGSTRWIQQVGNVDFPTTSLGVNDQYVAVVNGATLFVLERSTGRVVWQRQLKRAVVASPAITPEHVYVASITGELTSYRLDESELNPVHFGGNGGVFVSPTVTPRSFSWVTDAGHVYAVDLDTSRVRFNFRTDAAINSPIAHTDDTLFVASRDGYLYAINEQNGTLRWSFAVADPLKGEPAPIGAGLYVTAQRGGMYRLDTVTGAEVWYAPDVQQFIAASNDRIYATGRGEQIVILDAASGARIDQLPVDGLPIRAMNSSTDRIYLADPNGMILCLHEPQLTAPLVHAPVPAAAPAATPPSQPADTPATDAPTQPTPPPMQPLDEPEEIEDPFADPFG